MDKQSIIDEHKNMIKAIVFKLFNKDIEFVEVGDRFFVQDQVISLDFIENFPEVDFNRIRKEIKSIKISGNEEHPFFLSLSLKRDDWKKENDDNFYLYCEVSDLGGKEILPIFNNMEASIIEFERKLMGQKKLSDLIPDKIKINLLMEKENNLSEWSSNTIKDKNQWRTKVVIGNSVGHNQPNIGEYDKVRYICIGIKTATIVPIAIGDEHHCGGDYVNEMISLGYIPDDIYIPIKSSTNYLWNDDNIRELNYLKEAIKIWLELGGNNAIIYFSQRNVKITFKDFLKLTNSMSLEGVGQYLSNFSENKILPIGKSLINRLSNIALELRKKHLNQRFREKVIIDNADEICLISKEQFRFNKSIIEVLLNLEDAIFSLDIDRIENRIFSQCGLKNQIHIALKEALLESNNRGIRYDELKSMFGNLQLALNEFNALSRI